MQLILLSGGSGKRLWPLSNEARSKQFLRLLQNPSTGKTESMIQRVVRQIRVSSLTAPITIATNVQQQDIILTHLGHEAEVVAEPSRRDTFPAVCLACEYLSKVKNCAENEVVVVMPCDQYTEQSYFDVVASMAEIAASGEADLVVMGIKPQMPSSKFGYVLPQGKKPLKNGCYRVRDFSEKPSARKAQRLIEDGAFWNGGVFAFKLSFLLRISESYVKGKTFTDILLGYEDYPEISFDYEVAEKTSNMLMMPFYGKWKDLGTWEALLKEVEGEALGDVVEGHNNNTHVLNELQIPILCVGTKNLVVAASPDGILIADKEETESIKEYTDNFTARPMYEERRWGTYQVIDHVIYEDGYETLTKRLTLNPGCSISYQRHGFRDETWTFIDGEGEIMVDGRRWTVKRGDTISIKKGQKHALLARTSLSFIEVQAGSNLVESDIERFPHKW